MVKSMFTAVVVAEAAVTAALFDPPREPLARTAEAERTNERKVAVCISKRAEDNKGQKRRAK